MPKPVSDALGSCVKLPARDPMSQLPARSCTYLAHHELESVLIIIVIVKSRDISRKGCQAPFWMLGLNCCKWVECFRVRANAQCKRV